MTESKSTLTGIASTVLRVTSPLARSIAMPTQASPEPAGRTEARRYERVALLGEGGMGRVDRVRDRDLLRDIAVKHLRPALRADPSMLAQFLWEARVTAYLDHPNIIPVHDLGTDDGELYFTMKLVDGATLETVIADKQANLTRRLRTFLQLCSAVAFAHARGVLHRDLKPANVMVGALGEVIVTDWGLAMPLPGPAGESLRESLPDSLPTLSAGTPMYMSPEQARGDSLDARSDIYALGVILYELAALRAPFVASSVPELLAKVLRAEREPLETSPSLCAVIDRAMALDPKDRYADVQELGRDVEAVLDGHTPSAEHVSLARRAARYYVARDPAISKLRVVDIDSWAFSSMLAGAGIAMLIVRWLVPAAWVPIALLVGAAVIATPPTLRWLRFRRPSKSPNGAKGRSRRSLR